MSIKVEGVLGIGNVTGGGGMDIAQTPKRKPNPKRKRMMSARRKAGKPMRQPKAQMSGRKRTSYYSHGGRVCSDYMGSATIIKTKE